MCKSEKHINNFYKNYSECKECNSIRALKHFYEKKDETSNKRKKFYEKNRDKLLQKQSNKDRNSEELLRNCVELENRLNALQEKFSTTDSENNQIFPRWNLCQIAKKATHKTNVYHIGDIWSLDILALKVYSPENKRGYEYILVLCGYFSELGWTVPL